MEFEKKYARSLADMWNESDDAWPSAATGGVTRTKESVMEEMAHADYLAVYLSVVDGKVVAVCQLSEYARERDAAYVALLAAHPKFHGQGHGRRLLQKSVEFITEKGYKRLDLHSWAGNTKAIPLYKKTGFFYVPETSVYMQNYLPKIFNLPFAKEYFKKHDWYGTFKRDLTVKEDEYEERGIKLYKYVWEEKRDGIKVWVDKESGTICGIENKELSVRIFQDEQEAVAGIPHRIMWIFKNKTKKEVKLRVKVSPPDGIDVKLREKEVVLKGGGERRIESAFTIDVSTKEKDDDEPAHYIKSIIRIGKKKLELGTGLRIRQPVELTTFPEYLSAKPGTKTVFNLNMKSNMKRRVKGTVRFSVPKGVRLTAKAKEFGLPPGGFSGIPFEVEVPEKTVGVSPIKVTASFGKVKCRERILNLAVTDMGQVVARVDDEKKAVAENESLRLVMELKGGEVLLQDKKSGRGFVRAATDALGPPFWPSEFENKRYSYKLRNPGGRVKIIAYADSNVLKGITLIKEFTMDSGPLVKVRYKFKNSGKKSRKFKLFTTGWRELNNGTVVLPTHHGIVREQEMFGEFPSWHKDTPDKGYLSERWSAFEKDDLVLGWIWSMDAEKTAFHRFQPPGLTFPVPTVRPSREAVLKPFYIYAGPGDWRVVRKEWVRLVKSSDTGREVMELLDETKDETRRLVEAKSTEFPVIRAGEKAEVELEVTNLRMKGLNAALRLELPKGLRADRGSWKLEGINIENPFKDKVSISGNKSVKLGVYVGKLNLTEEIEDREFDFPVAVLGGQGKVEVSESTEMGKSIVILDNGLLRFKACPGFCASLYAVEKRVGKKYQNQLLTSFPRESQLSWFKPWFGGIQPAIFFRDWGFPGKLYREKFTAEKVEYDMRTGFWSGVRLKTRIKETEKLRGLRYEIEYLTLPGSNALKVVRRYTNTNSYTYKFRDCIAVYLALGGQRDGVHYFNRGGPRHRKRSIFTIGSHSEEGWAAVVNERKGISAALVSASSFSSAGIDDLGREGPHLGCEGVLKLGPREIKEAVSYFVLTGSPNDAKKYAWLRNLKD